MSDIIADIRNHLSTMAPHQRERLTARQLSDAADEIARLRITLARLCDIAASGSDPLERRRMLDRLGIDSFAEDG